MMAFVARKNLGLLTLGIWLVLTGVLGIAAVPIPALLMSVIALIAGVLLIAGR